WLWIPPAAVCAFAVVETRSRGAFVMAAAGLACGLLVGRPLRDKALVVLALLAVPPVLPGGPDSAGGKLAGGRTAAGRARDDRGGQAGGRGGGAGGPRPSPARHRVRAVPRARPELARPGHLHQPPQRLPEAGRRGRAGDPRAAAGPAVAWSRPPLCAGAR